MEGLEDQYGYDDEIFISQPPEYLKCIVCVLVLRDPVQILSCGHKFCAACFKRLQTHVQAKNSLSLSCPIDREVVETSDVRDDVAMRRIIGNLTVRCRHSEHGCVWTGDLRYLDEHLAKCTYSRLSLIRTSIIRIFL